MALHYASNNGHTDVVEILLQHTTNINIVTKVINSDDKNECAI